MYTRIMYQHDAGAPSCKLENHCKCVQKSKVYMWTRYCTCTSLEKRTCKGSCVCMPAYLSIHKFQLKYLWSDCYEI